MSDDPRHRARRELAWMALILGGLVVPVVAMLVLRSLGTPMRAVVAVTGLAVMDLPLIRAGVQGRGARGVVQPWKWTQYSLWLAVRVAILATMLLL